MYRFISRDNLSAAVDEAYLEELERRFDFRFPQRLRDYYLQHNGADIHASEFVAGGYRFCVAEMLAVKVGTLPVEKITANLDGEEGFEGYIPFAMDADYEYFYWHRETGQIVYIDREDAENLLPVCSSMDDFFEILNTINGKGVTND